MPGPKSMKRKRNGKTHIPNDKIQKLSGTVSLPDLSSTGPKLLSTLISEEELEITVDTLLVLAEYPSLIKSKPCKSLRAAVFDFRQACTTGVNTASKPPSQQAISAQ